MGRGRGRKDQCNRRSLTRRSLRKNSRGGQGRSRTAPHRARPVLLLQARLCGAGSKFAKKRQFFQKYTTERVSAGPKGGRVTSSRLPWPIDRDHLKKSDQGHRDAGKLCLSVRFLVCKFFLAIFSFQKNVLGRRESFRSTVALPVLSCDLGRCSKAGART